MKATLTFDLPEERNEHQIALKGQDYYSCLFQLDQEIRGFLKYEHKFKTPEEALEWVRTYIHENIDLDEVD